jgi:hypothetical protein
MDSLHHRLAVAAVLTTTVASAVPPGAATAPSAPPAPAPLAVLLPGSGELVIDHFADHVRALRVLSRANSAGAAEHVTARFEHRESVVTGGEARLAVALRYLPPVEVEDSLVMRVGGLVPEYERQRVQGTTTTVRYDGPRVWGTVTTGDSTRAFDHTFAHAVFPMNAIGAVVRSLPFAAGAERVIPVFSAQNGSITYDTVRVVRAERHPALDRRVWYVQFATPDAVTSYLVDAASREIVAQQLVLRADGTSVRLALAR